MQIILLSKIIDFVIPAIFTFILKDYFDVFLINRYSNKKVRFILWSTYFLIDQFIISLIDITGLPITIYSFLLLGLFCCLIYKNRINKILLIVLFIICIGVISEFLVALAYRGFFHTDDIKSFSLYGSICSKIFVLIIIRILKAIKLGKSGEIDDSNWIANIAIIIGSLYILYDLYVLSKNTQVVYGSALSTIILLLLDVICFKMFDKISSDAEIRRKNDIYRQSIEAYKREIELREENDEKIRKFRHDINNHFIVIEKLAHLNDTDRLIKYVDEIMEMKSSFSQQKISGNSLLDALFVNKFEIAEKLGINVGYKINLPLELSFEDTDLCAIVGNALDNAIEGAHRSGVLTPKINITIEFNHGNLLFIFMNSFNSTNFKMNKKLPTSKPDKTNHGFGITIMKEIAQKYDGTVDITHDNENFVVRILLYQQ